MAGDEGLDELFGGGQGQLRPRTGLAVALLASGLVLAGLGLVCSSAPGGILVLVSWVVVDQDLDRIEAGYLPIEFRRGLVALRAAIYVSVLLVVGLFAVQFWLLRRGFYDALWTAMLMGYRSLAGS